MAKSDLSDEDRKLLAAFHDLGPSPKVDTTGDLISFIKHYGAELLEEEHGKMGLTSKPTMEVINLKFPRISLFYGEDGKGEVNYQTWKYEVKCLLEEKTYTNEQILLGIRRSLRGEAANILRRMGTHAKVEDILRKFESTYGDIDTAETILKKLYACKQDQKETLVKYASRLEEIFSEAVEIGAVESSKEHLLKNVLYNGMKQPLKQLVNYKYETVSDYDRFKVECRKLETELAASSNDEKDVGKGSCKVMNVKAERSSELQEVKGLLEQMNERIKQLELGKEQSRQTVNSEFRWSSPRGGRLMHGNRGNFNRGGFRGSYRPGRPTGSNTFRPVFSGFCYHCQGQGHMARDCTEN